LPELHRCNQWLNGFLTKFGFDLRVNCPCFLREYTLQFADLFQQGLDGLVVIQVIFTKFAGIIILPQFCSDRLIYIWEKQ